ncbi:hypothetical protein BGZ75_007543, partial [Mortierella antarctica]
MLAASLVPISIVENQEFKDLIKMINLKYSVPARSTITDDLGILRSSLANKIEDILAGCSFGSFTADTWSRHKFLGVTFHWISKDFITMEITLAWKLFLNSTQSTS